MSQATTVKTVSKTELPKQISQIQPTPEQIRERAFEIYLSRNAAPGDEVQDWLQAERELISKQP